MMRHTRRQFLTAASLAAAAGLVDAPLALATEGDLETTSVRISRYPAICLAPQFVAEELLRAEGFTDVRYVDLDLSDQSRQPAIAEDLGRGKVDFDANTPWTLIRAIDAREPITALGGVHIGCYELFAKEGIRSIKDLKGGSVGVGAAGPTRTGIPTMLAAYVGLDPAKDINRITDPSVKPFELFTHGRLMPFWAFRRSRRSCALARSAMLSSAPPWTAPGHSISAACSRVTGNTFASTRSPRNGSCTPFSKPLICALAIPRKSLVSSSIAGLRHAMIMPSRP